MHDRETLKNWLRDAYAMEQGLVRTLRRQAEHADEHPHVRRKLEEHAALTENQASRVAGCLDRLGEDPSKVKTALGAVEGVMSGMMSAVAGDDVVKDALACYGAESFEIACYRALSVGARALGEDEIATTCEAILGEEEQMAQWVEQNLPSLVRDYLQAGATAGTR
jgi:ferritin-like metal-binding protein YciE